MILRAIFVCVVLFTQGSNPFAARVDRATRHLTLEILMVADWSVYQTWYGLTSSSDSHTARDNEAQQNIKTYITSLIQSSNNVYKSLESHNIYITLKVVDVLILTTKAASPYTETTKVRSADGELLVEPKQALAMFEPKSIELQSTIPHDHAMIFTQYLLAHEGGSSFNGYARTKAACYPRGISISADTKDFYTAQLMAHELGHSLGCEHDGDGNSCDSHGGYAMDADDIEKWEFSSCSVNYIRDFIQKLDNDNKNCLTTTNNHHVDPILLTNEWYGQKLSVDQQCVLQYGPSSYMCRNQYDGDYSNMCVHLYCHNPADDRCWWHGNGGDGSPCGSGKWCMTGQCVPSNQISSSVSDSCPAGDQPGVAYHGHTCDEIMTTFHSDCTHSHGRRVCCYTCSSHHTTAQITAPHHTAPHHTTPQHTTHTVPHHITTHAPVTSSSAIDVQCAQRHHGSAGVCRASYALTGGMISGFCSNLQCRTPNHDHGCLSSGRPDDGTSCGYRKWCHNGACVHDNSAPAVPDNCPWGDMTGVAGHGLTCDQIKHQYQWRCYESDIAKVCCAACNLSHRNVNGCEYGDKQASCVKSRCSTYRNNVCCETCRTSTPLIG